MEHISKLVFSTFFSLLFLGLSAQSFDKMMDQGKIRGNFQLDAQYYRKDSVIGAQEVPEKIRYNGFLNLVYTNGGFSAGVRYESYQNALLGFPAGYKGSGFVYRYAGYKRGDLSITVGNFYEQFGNGLIFRSYEARGLGYDNAMDGIRLKYKVYDGITLKGIVGKQRLFFDYGEGILRGFDAEIYLNETFKILSDSKTRIILGGSAISKYEADRNDQLVLPENVASFAGRLNISRGKVSLNGEYAYKINDPSADNGFIYKPGEALFLQTSYSQKGFGLVLSAKRNDNMSFRSERNKDQQNLLINYLPALTKQHTYNLLATLYPYATQLNGEVAFQADLIYNFNKGTPLGGKYGMDIQVNYSTANNIDTTQLNDDNTNRQGYTSKWLSIGEVYFKDFNVQLTKKFSKKVKGRFTYANLVFNKDVIQGKPGVPNIYANVGVADVTYKFNYKSSLRTELQGMITEQDQGDWVTLLFEYSYSPHWFVAILDQWNAGNPDIDKRVHYYNGSFGYSNKGNRFTISYGRQRAGIFCVGGVCRNVPASNGLYLSVTSSF